MQCDTLSLWEHLSDEIWHDVEMFIFDCVNARKSIFHCGKESAADQNS